MSVWKLRASLVGTLALIIGVSTLFFTFILSYIGAFSFYLLVPMVVGFNILQWLVSPYIIDKMYSVREADPQDERWIHEKVEEQSEKSGIDKPQVMIADLEIPNAFAYGSPSAGSRVAVTKGLLQKLERGEVEAVLAHEVGHLKNKDVQVMMFASMLPAIFYYIGFSMMWSGMLGGRRQSGGLALVGILSMIVYWILSLLILHLSRVREYFADRNAVEIVDDGANQLAQALAKIASATSDIKDSKKQNVNAAFKALFIEDPERSQTDASQISRHPELVSDSQLVERIASRELTLGEKITELFSSHPNIVKRLRALRGQN